MTETTHEPLHRLLFDSRDDLAEFLARIFETTVGPAKRVSPWGPLVIYGWPAAAHAPEAALYVTPGILRLAARKSIAVPAVTARIDSADQLPPGIDLLFATLGYERDKNEQ